MWRGTYPHFPYNQKQEIETAQYVSDAYQLKVYQTTVFLRCLVDSLVVARAQQFEPSVRVRLVRWHVRPRLLMTRRCGKQFPSLNRQENEGIQPVQPVLRMVLGRRSYKMLLQPQIRCLEHHTASSGMYVGKVFTIFTSMKMTKSVISPLKHSLCITWIRSTKYCYVRFAYFDRIGCL